MRKKPKRIRTPESIAKQRHTMAQKKLRVANQEEMRSRDAVSMVQELNSNRKKYTKKKRRLSVTEIAPDMYLVKILD